MHRLYAAFQRGGGAAQLYKLPLIKRTVAAPGLQPTFPQPRLQPGTAALSDGMLWDALQGGTPRPIPMRCSRGFEGL